MQCEEAVYSNDYYDIIGAKSGADPEVEDLCKQSLSERYVVYYLRRDQVPPLSVGTYKYINIPRCFTVLEQDALDVSGITRVQTQRNLELTGSGMMIGFLDTGERVIILSS